MSEPVLCWVANIVDVRFHGPMHERRNGTKHFSGGTKVYLLTHADYWDRFLVMGRHRGSSRFVGVVTPTRHFVNVRLKTIYDPHVLSALRHYGYDTPTVGYDYRKFWFIGYRVRAHHLATLALPAPITID